MNEAKRTGRPDVVSIATPEGRSNILSRASHADVVIVGAGFAGALAAAALARAGRRIIVLDSAAEGGARFGGELIHAAGVDLLADMGLWPIFAGGGSRIDGFRVTGHADDAPVMLPYADVPGKRPGGLAMDHQELVARARTHLSRCDGVELRSGAPVVNVLWKEGRVAGVRTAAGEEIRAPLTIAADGRHSRVRKAMGIEARHRVVSLSAIVLATDATAPSPGYGHICLGAWGPVLAYGLHDRDVRFCIDVPGPAEKHRERIARLLRTEYAPVLPEPLGSALRRAVDEAPVELCGNYKVETDRCIRPGAALIGDAGGCSHPLTASGMVNALNDIRVLTQELQPAAGGLERAGSELDRALARYQTRRYRFVRVRELLADALYSAFRNDTRGAQAVTAGILRYWRTSARGRATTVALLSGDDARLTTFVTEYLRVMGQSVRGVVEGGDVPLQHRAHSLAGLARESLDLLNRVGAGVYAGTLR